MGEVLSVHTRLNFSLHVFYFGTIIYIYYSIFIYIIVGDIGRSDGIPAAGHSNGSRGIIFILEIRLYIIYI
jgi:hypothetical protein